MKKRRQPGIYDITGKKLCQLMLVLVFSLSLPAAAGARDIPCGPGEKLCDGICIPADDPCGGGNDDGGEGGEPSLEDRLAERVDEARRSFERIEDDAGGLSSGGIAEVVSKSGDLLEEIEAAEADARQSVENITALINEHSGWEAEQREQAVLREYEQTGSSIGDPVRPGAGAYHMEITDMSFPFFGIEVNLRRRYQSGCPGSCSFGPGWFCSWDSRIYRCFGPDAEGLAAAVGAERRETRRLADYARGLSAELQALLENDDFRQAVSTAEASAAGLIRRLRVLIEELDEIRDLAFPYNYREVLRETDEVRGRAGSLLREIEELQSLTGALPGAAEGAAGTAELSRLSAAAGERLARVRAEAAYAAFAAAGNPSLLAAGDPACYEHAGIGYAVLIDEDGVPRLYRFSGEPRLFSSAEDLTGADAYFPRGCELLPVSGTGDRLSLREDGCYLLKKQDGRSFLYSSGGRLQWISDRSGNRVRCSYDAAGRLVRISDETGRSMEMERSDGRLCLVRGPDGTALTYAYDAAGRLASVCGPEGRLVSYEYGPGGLCRIIKPDASAVEIEYRLTGGRYRVVLVRDETGGEEHFSYDPARQRTRYTDKAGVSIDHYYNERQQEVGTEYPDGSRACRRYDEAGRLVERIDRSGGRTRYRYDERNNCIETSGPGDFHETASYDANGLLLRHCDGRGAVTMYRYSASGNCIEVIRPDGVRERMEYDDRGFLIRLTDARNCVYRYERDEYGNRVRQINPDGGVVSSIYDLYGRLTGRTGPEGGHTRCRYSPAGLLLEIEGPEGGTAHFEYDERKDLIRYRDQRGVLRCYSYDDCHRLLRVEGPGDKSISFHYRKDGKMKALFLDGRPAAAYAYDAEGKCSEIRYPGTGIRHIFRWNRAGLITGYTDPKGLETRYAYDARGRLISVRSPSGRFRRFSYDGNGNLIRYSDEGGSVFHLEYDPADRLIECRGPCGALLCYGYDAGGNCVSIRRSPQAVVRMDYDCLNRLTAAVYPGGGREDFRYDKAGRLSFLRGRNGGEWHYDYDKAGRLIGIQNPLGDEEVFAYDAGGLLVSYTDGGGAVSRVEYDAAGRPTAFINAAGGRTEYRFGSRGELLSRRDGEGRRCSFEHDLLLRLTAEIDPAGRRREYGYDKNGNLILRRDENGAEERWEHREAEGTVVYTDADGACSIRRYDAGGRLIREETAPGVCRSFLYDALGRIRREEESGGFRRAYTYDTAGNCSEIKESGCGTIRIAHDAEGRPVRFVYADDSEKILRYDASGRISEAESEEGVLCYRYDLLGRLTEAGDADGRRRRYEYDAAGRPLRISDFGPDDSLLGESVYSYGPAGLLRRLEDSSGAAIEFSYDRSGREVLRSIDGRLFVRRFYGSDGRLSGFCASYGDPEVRRDILAGEVYLYDSCGRKTRSVNINGDHCSFHYSPGGRLISAAYPLSSEKAEVDRTERLRLFGMQTADGSSRIDGTSQTNGSIRLDGSAASGIWTAAAGGLSDLGLPSFSPMSGFTEEYAPLSAEEVQRLANRLRNVFGPRKAGGMRIQPVWREEFSYDQAGNRICKENPLGRIEYRYGDGGQLLQAGDCRYSYDEGGRQVLERLPGGDCIFSYDRDGRLSALQRSEGGAGDRSVRYRCDALGRRCLREEYRVDAQGEVLLSRTQIGYNGQSVCPARLESLLPAVLPEREETAVRKARRDGGSRYRPPEQPPAADPAGREAVPDVEVQPLLSAGEPDAAGRDALGGSDAAAGSEGQGSGTRTASSGLLGMSPAGTASAEKQLRIVYAGPEPLLSCSGGRAFVSLGSDSPCYSFRYDSREERLLSRFHDCFGNTLFCAAGIDGSGADVIEENNLINYNGKMLDPVSGCYDAGFRDYRPGTGRFLSPDPLRAGDRYTYADGDPVNRCDPDGLSPVYSSDITGRPVSAFPGRDLKAEGMIDIIRSGRRGSPEEGWYHDRIQLRIGSQVLCDSPVQATADHPLLNSSPDRMGGDLAAGVYCAELYTVIWKYKHGIQIIDDYLIHPDRFTLDSLYGRPGCGPWDRPYSLGCAIMKIEDFDAMTAEIQALGFVYRDNDGDRIPVRLRGRKHD